MRAIAGFLFFAAVAGAHAQGTTATKWTPDPALGPALEIINAKRVAEYPKAIRELRGLVEENRAKADAIAYLRWVEADLQVHFAEALFKKGQRDRAVLLLDLALKSPVLGPKPRAKLEAMKAAMLAGPVPQPPSDQDEPKVKTVSGKELARSRTFELQDPESGQPFYLDLMDPAATRKDKLGPSDPRPTGDTLLDVLARGGAPAEGTPGDLGNGAALGGATDALGGIIR